MLTIPEPFNIGKWLGVKGVDIYYPTIAVDGGLRLNRAASRRSRRRGRETWRPATLEGRIIARPGPL